MKKYKSSVVQTYLVLKKYSDENHILRISDIFKYLSSQFDINIDRRTLYANIEILNQAGIEISDFNDNGIGYYLISRDLAPSQVTILCHQIAATGFLTSHYSQELINNLLDTQSIYHAQRINQTLINKVDHKTDNQEVLLNLEILLEAIAANKMIKMTYNEYNLSKKLVSKKKDSYLLHPYFVVINEDLPYLICRYDNKDDLSFYRIDNMKNVKILETNRKEIDPHFNPYYFIKSKTYMYNGPTEWITLKCQNNILKYIIEDFGKEVHLEKLDENSFIAKMQSSKQGILYWCARYMDYCEIIEPQSYRDAFIENLEKNLKKYKTTQ